MLQTCVQRLVAAVLCPRRHGCVETGAAGRVRVHVGRDPMSVRARRLHDLDHAIHLRPVGLARRLEVIDLGRKAGLPADANQFLDRFDQPIPFAAHVGDVNTVVLRSDLRDLDQLVGRRVEAGRVNEG